MTPPRANHSFLKPRNWAKAAFFLWLLVCTAQAQGVRGVVTDIDNNTLPFASVFFPDLSIGASTNTAGAFQVRLPAGTHQVVVQFLGYQTLKAAVTVPDSGFVTTTFQLYPQTAMLREAEVGSKREDPAVGIMRKAIAKSKFHLLQYDGYSCRVYTKGSGKVEKAPKLIARELKKEGFIPGETYASESLIEVTFNQPDKITERVIAISERRDRRGPSPAPYINQSFYNPYVSGGVSPLSPAAFFYYNFYYLGGFEEDGQWINKIRVIPKTFGEQVFQGDLLIIENTWAIHSLDFTTYLSGFKLSFSQLHSPVVADVWMPIKHELKFSGSVLGVQVAATYHAVVSNYQITLNETVRAAARKAVAELPDLAEPVKESKATAKAYKSAAKTIEKALQEEQDAAIVSERTYIVDSMARKQDSLFWDLNRPIALTEEELQGYKNADSTVTADEADSNLTAPGNTFKPADLLAGNRYRIAKQTRLTLRPTWSQTQFNTAEGLVLQMKAQIDQKFGANNPWRMELAPHIRYGIASGTTMGTVRNRWLRRNDLQSYYFEIEGGSMVRQYNAEAPIHHLINSMYTLFARQNFMKLYRHEFVEARFYKNFQKRFELEVKAGHFNRRAMDNASDFSFFWNQSREFTPNLPDLTNQDAARWMPAHCATVLDVKLDWRPGLKYRIRNGKLLPNSNSASLVTAQYRKGFYEGGRGFDHLQLRFENEIALRISGRLSWVWSAGTFFKTQPLLPDWAHFTGNQTLFAPIGEVGAFRTLPYYAFSTNDWYAEQRYTYTFRRLLLSQIPKVRLLGVKEQLFCNVLVTPSLVGRPFVEVGYSADRIYRFFRFEVAWSNRMDAPGFRVGLSSLIQFD